MVIYDIRYKPNVSAAVGGNGTADCLQVSPACEETVCCASQRIPYKQYVYSHMFQYYCFLNTVSR